LRSINDDNNAHGIPIAVSLALLSNNRNVDIARLTSARTIPTESSMITSTYDLSTCPVCPLFFVDEYASHHSVLDTMGQQRRMSLHLKFTFTLFFD